VPITLHTTPDPGFWSLVYKHRVIDKDVDVRFLLSAPRTLLTAAAAAHLATQHDGNWSGEAMPYLVAFDVTRPVRPMTFGRPIDISGLIVAQALVRTSDFRGQYALPTDASADPSEIIVTGRAGRTSAVLNAIIGQDLLSSCASISYVGATRMLTLLCPRPGSVR
jgi:hypothetical protein